VLVGLGLQHRACLSEDRPGRLDGGQRLTDLSAGGPDSGAVEQPQEFGQRPLPLGYAQGLLGELLGPVEVVPLEREAGQRPQVIDGEEVPFESQP
jgi:hypothetical protein